MKNGFLLVGFAALLSACGVGQSSGPLYSVALSCTPTTLTVGQSGACAAIAKDAAGNAISPQPSYFFSSSNASVASVSNKGVIKASAVGSVQIAALTNPPAAAKSSLPVTVQVIAPTGTMVNK
jgi:uncharacterized protein YjdB